MKLSMWLIANRLGAFDTKLDIRPNAPMVLRSARQVYATHSVYVHSQGNDSLCEGEGGKILLRDMTSKQALEIIQSIFDEYDEWDDHLGLAIEKLQFNEIANICHRMLQTPLLFSDSNFKILGLTRQYADFDDDEWKYLYKNGYHSIPKVNAIREDKGLDFEDGAAQYICVPEMLQNACISCNLYDGEVQFGRCIIIEGETRLNNGSLQLCNYFCRKIESVLKMNRILKSDSSVQRGFLLELINGKVYDDTELERQMRYFDISENEIFELAIIRGVRKLENIDPLVHLRSLLEDKLPGLSTYIWQSNLILFFEKSKCKIDIINIMRQLEPYLCESDLECGASLPYISLKHTGRFYHQCLVALDLKKKQLTSRTYLFYSCAIEAILTQKYSENPIFSAHPDLIILKKYDTQFSTEYYKTLRVLLRCERSITAAAQELFIHRNTMVYRINKIKELLVTDINDHYTREYMMLSFRIYDLYYK